MKPRVPQVAEAIAHEVGTALVFCHQGAGRVPGHDDRDEREVHPRREARRGARQLAGRSRNRWASSAASRRGTTRCTRWSARSRRRWPPAAPWCSSPPRWRRSAPSCSPRRRTKSGCRPACSTSCRATAAVVGEAIVAHPDVDMVSFTGSLQAGRRVASVAGDGIKKVCLELGGKSAVPGPRRCAVREGDPGRREQLHAELRADLLGVDAHAGAARAARRGRGTRQGAARQADARRSVRRRHAARPAGLGRPARHRARLHRAGQEGGRDARRRRRPARGAGHGLLRRADDLRERRQRA